MTDPLPSRRPECGACLRAQSACICRWAAPVSSGVELLILQHPLEVRNAKNSARLLHLCLPESSRIVVGEAFAPGDLETLLHGGGCTPLLLYPETPGVAAPGVATPGVAAPDDALPDEAVPDVQPAALRLVLLDATWRKSRKMLYLNPSLQRLPRLALQAAPPSAYLIRKAHAPHQLSTLEAAAHALAQLEGAPARYRPLLAAFEGFVQQQAAQFRA